MMRILDQDQNQQYDHDFHIFIVCARIIYFYLFFINTSKYYTLYYITLYDIYTAPSNPLHQALKNKKSVNKTPQTISQEDTPITAGFPSPIKHNKLSPAGSLAFNVDNDKDDTEESNVGIEDTDQGNDNQSLDIATLAKELENEFEENEENEEYEDEGGPQNADDRSTSSIEILNTPKKIKKIIVQPIEEEQEEEEEEEDESSLSSTFIEAVGGSTISATGAVDLETEAGGFQVDEDGDDMVVDPDDAHYTPHPSDKDLDRDDGDLKMSDKDENKNIEYVTPAGDDDDTALDGGDIELDKDEDEYMEQTQQVLKEEREKLRAKQRQDNLKQMTLDDDQLAAFLSSFQNSDDGPFPHVSIQYSSNDKNKQAAFDHILLTCSCCVYCFSITSSSSDQKERSKNELKIIDFYQEIQQHFDECGWPMVRDTFRQNREIAQDVAWILYNALSRRSVDSFITDKVGQELMEMDVHSFAGKNVGDLIHEKWMKKYQQLLERIQPKDRETDEEEESSSDSDSDSDSSCVSWAHSDDSYEYFEVAGPEDYVGSINGIKYKKKRIVATGCKSWVC